MMQVSPIRDQRELLKATNTSGEVRLLGSHLGAWLCIGRQNPHGLELCVPPSGFLCIF